MATSSPYLHDNFIHAEYFPTFVWSTNTTLSPTTQPSSFQPSRPANSRHSIAWGWMLNWMDDHQENLVKFSCEQQQQTTRSNIETTWSVFYFYSFEFLKKQVYCSFDFIHFVFLIAQWLASNCRSVTFACCQRNGGESFPNLSIINSYSPLCVSRVFVCRIHIKVNIYGHWLLSSSHISRHLLISLCTDSRPHPSPYSSTSSSKGDPHYSVWH